MLEKDLLLLAQALAPVVARHINDALAPLTARLAEIEKRLGEELPALLLLRQDLESGLAEQIAGLPAQIERFVDEAISGEAAKVCSIARTEIAAWDKDKGLVPTDLAVSVIAAEVSRQIDVLPKPKDGEDADPETIKSAVTEEVARQIAALPPAPAGKDADPELVRTLVVAAVDALPKPQDGKSVSVEELRPMVAEIVGAAIAELPPPRDGRDVDPETVRAMVADAVTALPPPAPGRDADPEAVRVLVVEEVGKAVAALPVPKDGASVTLDDIRPIVAEAVLALPPPKDGKSVVAEDVRPLLQDLVDKAVAGIPAAKDGVGVAGAVIDRDGELVVTLSNGETVKLGRVVGKNGDPGSDGLGFDDIDIVHDGGRGFNFRLMRGEAVKEFPFVLPVVLDRGVFKDGADYVAGDGVTCGGNFWIAQAATKDRPGTSDAWRLAVRKGRDGKDAEAPKPPKPVKL